jgi:transcriptional regulator of acetoin/glycerol metabolism
MPGLDLFRQLLPYLAARLTLAQFTALALALGARDDRPRPLDLEDLAPFLKDSSGNVSEVARKLGVCTKTIYRRLAAQGLPVSSFRPSPIPSP